MLFKTALTFYVIYFLMIIIGAAGEITKKGSTTHNFTYCFITACSFMLGLIFTALGCIGLIWF